MIAARIYVAGWWPSCRWSNAPDLDKPSSRRWKYSMPAYGCQRSTAVATPRNRAEPAGQATGPGSSARRHRRRETRAVGQVLSTTRTRPSTVRRHAARAVSLRTSASLSRAERVKVDLRRCRFRERAPVGRDLLVAEPDGAVVARRSCCHIARPREMRNGPTPRFRRLTSHTAARRFSSSRPTTRESCWQAKALTSASNTVGNRGGFRPRNRSASSASRRSRCATRYHSERSICNPSSRSTIDRTWRLSARRAE